MLCTAACCSLANWAPVCSMYAAGGPVYVAWTTWPVRWVGCQVRPCLSLLLLCSCSPDLSCLEHHQQLFSLDVAAAACAAGSSWALHSLQLGHLVHLEALRELRLAEGCCEEASTSPRGSSGNSCRGSPGMKGTGSYRSGCSKGRCATRLMQALEKYCCSVQPACAAPCLFLAAAVQAYTCREGQAADRCLFCTLPCCCSHWLPCCSGHPSQITSLELSGPVTDQSLGQLPGQFPGLKRLTVDSSYFARCSRKQQLGLGWLRVDGCCTDMCASNVYLECRSTQWACEQRTTCCLTLVVSFC